MIMGEKGVCPPYRYGGQTPFSPIIMSMNAILLFLYAAAGVA